MMDFHFSTWGYRIEPTADGCRVTEWSEDLRPESVMEFSKQMSGVDDRTARNRETLSATLERLAAALEACPSHPSDRAPPDQAEEPAEPTVRVALPGQQPGFKAKPHRARGAPVGCPAVSDATAA